jgi:hypothetical protein
MVSGRLFPTSLITLRRREGRRMLLITGTPGTGKRQLANYLEMQRGFVHVDLDNRDTRTLYLRSGGDEFRSELNTLTASNSKVIVTWNFTSETQLPYVETLRSLGFEWIWMDGDRGAGFDALVVRNSSIRPPRFVDTFEADGSFRALEGVTGELRGRRALPPMPKALISIPAMRATLLRPVWAGVAAFAIAATAAAVAYTTGVINPSTRPATVATTTHRAALPVNGVFVRGTSLGGISLGDTATDVRVLWGPRYSVCDGCNPMTWFYFDPKHITEGVGITFRHGIVTAVFTLGMNTGWHTPDGITVGRYLPQFNNQKGDTKSCAGFGATSTRSGNAITSILTNGQIVYGFALTRPSEPVCRLGLG